MPPSSFVTGSEVVKDKLMLGNAHGLNGPNAPVLLSDVDDMIPAHSAREAAVLEGEGGSKKRKSGGKAPRKGPK